MSEAWLATFGDGTTEAIEVSPWPNDDSALWKATDSAGDSTCAHAESGQAADVLARGHARLRGTYVASLGPYEEARDAAAIERAVHAERDACVDCIRALADGKPLRDAAVLRLAATILRRCRESGATIINSRAT